MPTSTQEKFTINVLIIGRGLYFIMYIDRKYKIGLIK